MRSLGSGIDPRTLMGNLSVAEQQVVEISKAVSANAEIVIMDEPTAALSKRECEELYRITEQLRSEGKSILFISHRLEDMYRLADSVTVFRDASYIGDLDPSRNVTIEILVQANGRKRDQGSVPQGKGGTGRDGAGNKECKPAGIFQECEFSVRKGEILGLTGLVGAGARRYARRCAD